MSSAAFDRVQAGWERDALQAKAAALWQRARTELGRRYAVGFLGEGMRRPLWTSNQVDEDHDDGCFDFEL